MDSGRDLRRDAALHIRASRRIAHLGVNGLLQTIEPRLGDAKLHLVARGTTVERFIRNLLAARLALAGLACDCGLGCNRAMIIRCGSYRLR